MANRTNSGAELAEMNERGQNARDSIDMDKIRGMQFIPKNKGSWHHQYIYGSEDRGGKVIPLTGEIIDFFLHLLFMISNLILMSNLLRNVLSWQMLYFCQSLSIRF